MKNIEYNILVYGDTRIHKKITLNVNSDLVENLQSLLHNLSLFSYDAVVIGMILYEENVNEIVEVIRKITFIPIIVLINSPESWRKELIYAGVDCVININSTTEEINLNIFSLIRRNKQWKVAQVCSDINISEGKLVIDRKHYEIKWANIKIHLTRQEYDFLYLLASSPRRIYTFEQIYQLVWKDYPVGDIKNIIWCLVKRLRKKLNVVEDGAGNCIISVRDIGCKFELNNENEQQ